MSDDFEDYSDGEAPVPLSQRPGRPTASTSRDNDDTGGYRMKGSLKAPRPTSYTTQALFGALSWAFDAPQSSPSRYFRPNDRWRH